MKNLTKHFETLSVQAIQNERPGDVGDFELLDVIQRFQSNKDPARTIATFELLLRSAEISESVNYYSLYFDLAEELKSRKEFSCAAAWLQAAIAYDEQHKEGDNRSILRRDLASVYLAAADFDTALAIHTRSLLSEPDDVWIHNTVALDLSNCGLASLAVEVLERGLKVVRVENKEQLRSQFEKMCDEAKAKLAKEKNRISEISPQVLQAFRDALSLKKGAAGGYAAYHAPLDQLITATDAQFQALMPEILQHGKVFAPDLIRMANEMGLANGPAVGRALTLLHQIAMSLPVEFRELKHWVEEADTDWQHTLGSSKIGKVGGFTNAGLELFASDTKFNTYMRNNAAEALLERMKDETAPDEHVIAFLRRLLTRSEAYESAEEETFVTFLICTIADYKVNELYPEIEQVFREDRADVQITDLAQIQKDMGMTVTESSDSLREDGLNLPVKCKVCGRERMQFVKFVTIDTGTIERKAAGKKEKYDEHVMDREIICPKCGACDQFELTPMASLLLYIPTGEEGMKSLLGLLRGKKETKKPVLNPRIQRIQSVIMDKPMNPLEGIDRYRELIAKEPNNADNYVRLGNILRVIHRHPQALEAFRKSYELNRTDPDCALSYAMAEHDFGDRLRAKELYVEFLVFATGNPFSRHDIVESAQIARQGLEALEKKQGSPWDIRNDHPHPPPAQPAKEKASPTPPKLSKSQAQAIKKKKRKLHKRHR